MGKKWIVPNILQNPSLKDMDSPFKALFPWAALNLLLNIEEVNLNMQVVFHIISSERFCVLGFQAWLSVVLQEPGKLNQRQGGSVLHRGSH